MNAILLAISLYFVAPSARSLALVGVPLEGYQDPSTAWSNPAYLALKKESNLQLGHIDIPLGLPAAALDYNTIDSLINENTIASLFNLGYYAINGLLSQSDVLSPQVLYDYFYSGRYLSAQDKLKFLSMMKNGYAPINTDIELFTLNVSSGGFGISLKQSQYIKLRLPRELFSLLFFGNQLDSTYNFNENNTSIEELSSITLTVSYSHEFMVHDIPFYIGAGLRFTRAVPFSQIAEGIPDVGYIRLNSLNFAIKTDSEKIVLDGGRVELLHGSGQVATGIDLGIAVRPIKGLAVGISLINMGAKIGFTDRDSLIWLDLKSDTIYSLTDSISLGPDTVITAPAQGYTAPLPHLMKISAVYQLSDMWGTPSIGTQLTVSFNETVASEKGTVLTFAGELHPTSWLPLRFSFGFGRGGPYIGYGFGLRLKGLHWDFGFQNIGATGMRSRGGRMMSDFWISL